MCELPPSTDSKTSDDKSIDALTLNRRQFLPEKIELSFNFPNAAKLERGGKMRGLDLESRNFEGWEWRWNVVGPWKVVLGHASIFSVKVCDFEASFCWSWWLWKWSRREKKKKKKRFRYPNSAIWFIRAQSFGLFYWALRSVYY